MGLGAGVSVALGAVAVVALIVAVAVYRYRRCYDGTYEIDAERAAEGFEFLLSQF